MFRGFGGSRHADMGAKQESRLVSILGRVCADQPQVVVAWLRQRSGDHAVESVAEIGNPSDGMFGFATHLAPAACGSGQLTGGPATHGKVSTNILP